MCNQCSVTSITRSQKLLLPCTHEKRLESFESFGHLEPVSDGSCQVAHQLATLLKNPKSLRQEFVAYLTCHPCAADGTPLSRYIKEIWSEYIQSMAQQGTAIT